MRDKERIINGVSWAFINQLLVFSEFNSDLRPDKYRFDKAMFWTCINCLPWNLMSTDIVERMGNKIGKLVKLIPIQEEVTG